jgi:HAMP domain-containing protein
MANTQAMATSFKGELLNAYHNFSATNPARTINTADTFKAALYLATATYNATTTAYAATGEVSGTGYTAGGVNVGTWNAPTTSGTTGFTTPTASITYTTVTLTTAFDAVLIYNNSQTNRAVSVHTFGSQTVTAGTFTLTMPTNNSTSALIRLA